MGISPGACGGADMERSPKEHADSQVQIPGKTGGNLRYNLPTLFYYMAESLN